MNYSKALILAGFAILVVKVITSLLGKNEIPLLNQVVTLILVTFIVFELFQLGQGLWGQVS